jgi:transposase-like protein
MPKQYPAEFRQRVIASLDAGRKVADIAADLDVSANTIYIWRRQHLVGSGVRHGRRQLSLAELRKAQREITKP